MSQKYFLYLQSNKNKIKTDNIKIIKIVKDFLKMKVSEVEVIDAEYEEVTDAVAEVSENKEDKNSNMTNTPITSIPAIMAMRAMLILLEEDLSSTENITREELERHINTNNYINSVARSFHATVTEETPKEEFEALLYIMDNQNRVTAKLRRLAKTIK